MIQVGGNLNPISSWKQGELQGEYFTTNAALEGLFALGNYVSALAELLLSKHLNFMPGQFYGIISIYLKRKKKLKLLSLKV